MTLDVRQISDEQARHHWQNMEPRCRDQFARTGACGSLGVYDRVSPEFRAWAKGYVAAEQEYLSRHRASLLPAQSTDEFGRPDRRAD